MCSLYNFNLIFDPTGLSFETDTFLSSITRTRNNQQIYSYTQNFADKFPFQNLYISGPKKICFQTSDSSFNFHEIREGMLYKEQRYANSKVHL
jgi:hypothetical protein